jgi:tellurite resistance protein TerC
MSAGTALAAPGQGGIASVTLWSVAVAALVLLLVVDTVITRRPHEVRMREAVTWSVFYLVLPEPAQRVLLYGIAGALVLRTLFIVLGAAALRSGTWVFLLFGGILIVTAGKVIAVDSVPAVYGVTDDPFLVFATNAFALLGLRALYFVLRGVLARLRHLNHGLAIILAFIGVKLVLHWAHGIWARVPEIPTLASLGVIVAALITVTLTSLHADRTGRHATPPGDEAGKGTLPPHLSPPH